MYHNVLVAIEPLDPAAGRILAAARRLTAPGAEPQVLYVMDDRGCAFFLYSVYSGAAGDALRAHLHDSARKALAELCQPFGIAPEHQRVEVGHPAIKIRHTAESLECDLIVMGTHAQGGLRGTLGSVANAVLHGTGTDVYCVCVSASAPGEVSAAALGT